MTLGLNALAGKQQSPSENMLWISDWNSKNARDLMEYSMSKEYTILLLMNFVSIWLAY